MVAMKIIFGSATGKMFYIDATAEHAKIVYF